MERLAGEPVRLNELLLFRRRTGFADVGQWDASALRKLFDGFLERDALSFRYEREHGSAGAAPKAVVELLLRRD